MKRRDELDQTLGEQRNEERLVATDQPRRKKRYVKRVYPGQKGISSVEDRGDYFAGKRIDKLKERGNFERIDGNLHRVALPDSVSVIDHLLNDGDIFETDGDLEGELLGELSAAYQAGFKAGARRAK